MVVDKGMKNNLHAVKSWVHKLSSSVVMGAWLAQLVECQSAVREVEGSSPTLDQHSGS